jgi:magnesium chelatase family protein
VLAVISSHAPLGMEGELVSVEVDIRNGIPRIDVVGLPDGAVRESRERVRVAIRNSGFDFPEAHILVSLAPAAVRKEGASFDLPIALGVLCASEQITMAPGQRAMVLGELNLGGAVRPVSGVLPAVSTGLAAGIDLFFVPRENVREARVLGRGAVTGIGSLREAAEALKGGGESAAQNPGPDPQGPSGDSRRQEDISDIRGHKALKRALEVAAAGRHHMLLFGPPGSGKTMAARRLPSLLPALDRDQALAVTRVHSIAGVLPPGSGILDTPPFRMPHHSASPEGILGGGRLLRPGEVSLAHNGVLFLDEAPEFGMSLLQGLREPVEDGWVSIARAGCSVRYPASLQLVLAFNPCPCGNLGRPRHACRCSGLEVSRYWRRVGGALLDRVDIRVPLEPVPPDEMCEPPDAAAEDARRARVAWAVAAQRERFAGSPFPWNSRIPPGELDAYCPLSAAARSALLDAGRTLCLSSRALHSVIRLARTLADLAGAGDIREEDVVTASGFRRYGDEDYYWTRAR